MRQVPEAEESSATTALEAESGVPPVALDLPDTAGALLRYRRRAGYWVNAGAGMLAAVVALAALSSYDESLATALAPPLLGLGLGALATGFLLLSRARRMRRILGSAPWVAHASVATPLGTGPATVVLAGGPSGDELLVLAPHTVQWRYHLVSGPAGVLWWCGGPRTGGVLAPAGGKEMIWARSVRAGRAGRILTRPQVRNLSYRPPPRQPQLWPASARADAAPARSRPSATPPVKTRPAWWRGIFRWLLLTGALALLVAAVRIEKLDHMNDAELRGAPSYAFIDTVAGCGLLLLLTGAVGGAVRRWPALRRPSKPNRAGSVQRYREPVLLPAGTGAPDERPVCSPGPPDHRAFAAEAERQAGLRPPGSSKQSPGAGTRAVPWWRMRALLKISGLPGTVYPLSYALAVGVVGWIRPGTFSAYISALAAAFGLFGLCMLVRTSRYGIPRARRLARHAVAPDRRIKRYALMYERSGAGSDPVLVLFPADAGDSTPPEALLRLVSPGPARRPWSGLPAPAGSAELSGWLDGPPLAVAWIEGRPYWPLDGYEQLDPSAPETCRALEDLLGARV